jgi:hypothetical protein
VDREFVIDRQYLAANRLQDIAQGRDGTWLMTDGRLLRVPRDGGGAADRRHPTVLVDPLPTGFSTDPLEKLGVMPREPLDQGIQSPSAARGAHPPAPRRPTPH